MAGLPDLVYVVGPGSSGHEELRYSLRSVAKNLPHGKVFVAGQVPDFISGCEVLNLQPKAEKYQNIRQSLEAAVFHPDISDSFVLMNDDFFVVRPVQHPLSVFHLGPISRYLQHLESIGKQENEWMRSLRETSEWCAGDPNCYETHTPLTFSTEGLRAVLRAFPHDRTFTPTGVYQLVRAGLEGVLGPDVKVSADSPEPDPEIPFLSSVDWSFDLGPAGRIVRSLFPEKCRYEA